MSDWNSTGSDPFWKYFFGCLGTGFVLVLGLGLAAVHEENQQKRAAVSNKDLVAPFNRELKSYWHGHHHHEDEWLIEDYFPSFESAYMKGEDATPSLKKLLLPYQGTSTLSSRILMSFRGLVPFLVSQEGRPVANDRKYAGLINEERWVPYTLYPKLVSRHAPANFSYRQALDGEGHLCVVAVRWSKPILIARLYHELGHAYYHRIRKAPSSMAKPMTDSWIEEEIEMHLLETEILNKMSEGKFFALYESIYARAERADEERETFANVLNAVKKEDLLQLDRIFGLEKAGTQTTKTHMGVFFLGLLMHYAPHLAAANDAAEVQAIRMRMYRWRRKIDK